MLRVAVRRKGLVDYAAGLDLQKAAREEVLAGLWDGVLLLLEHRPVITTGRGGGLENFKYDRHWLEEKGIDLQDTERGGNITCHNPGQLVGYPVLNLSLWRQDVHWYVERLEEVLIQMLAEWDVLAGRKACYTGAWVKDRKIAAIGVSVRHWITGHGFALNVDNDLSLFQAVVPCGIEEFGVTSLAAEGIAIMLPEVIERTAATFAQVFECEVFDEEKGN